MTVTDTSVTSARPRLHMPSCWSGTSAGRGVSACRAQTEKGMRRAAQGGKRPQRTSVIFMRPSTNHIAL
jgi:hypothetical protein